MFIFHCQWVFKIDPVFAYFLTHFIVSIPQLLISGELTLFNVGINDISNYQNILLLMKGIAKILLTVQENVFVYSLIRN